LFSGIGIEADGFHRDLSARFTQIWGDSTREAMGGLEWVGLTGGVEQARCNRQPPAS